MSGIYAELRGRASRASATVNRLAPARVDGKSIYTRSLFSKGMQMEKTIQVRAFWDEDAKVWVAVSHQRAA